MIINFYREINKNHKRINHSTKLKNEILEHFNLEVNNDNQSFAKFILDSIYEINLYEELIEYYNKDKMLSNRCLEIIYEIANEH